MPEPVFSLDRPALRRAFERAAPGYDQAAFLQTEVRSRLLARLDYTTLEPAVIVDLGCATGQGSRALKDRYPRARVIALDLAPAMLREARRRQSLFRRFARVCGDARQLPLATASVDLLFANLLLPWCADLDAVFTECRRVLRPRGLLNFSTLGPDTLWELRAAWAAADGGVHVNAFTDMHDLGDGLLRAGLADAVLDVERMTLTYREVGGLMRELKASGAHNVNASRARGLTGRGRLAAVAADYERHRREGVLPASVEVVFGQAWAPAHAPQRGRRSGEFVFDAASIGRRAGPGG
jgi:malonyl-CoA O-methyltransferase